MENWCVKISATLDEIEAEVETCILKDLSKIELTEELFSLLDAELTLLGLDNYYTDCDPNVIISKIVNILLDKVPINFIKKANICGTRFNFIFRTI